MAVADMQVAEVQEETLGEEEISLLGRIRRRMVGMLLWQLVQLDDTFQDMYNRWCRGAQATSEKVCLRDVVCFWVFV